MSGEAIAIVGAAVGLLGVLVPLLLTLAAGIRRELDALRGDVHDLRTRVDALSDRVARIEGALTGPWRPQPANGNPAVAPPVAPSPEARTEAAPC